MNYCEVKSSQKGQTLKNMSGLSEFSTYSFISGFERDNFRMPELDEIPHANSEPYLDKQLKVVIKTNSIVRLRRQSVMSGGGCGGI